MTYFIICTYIKLTWYSDPFLLHDQGIDGHKVKWQINEWTEPGHCLIPKATMCHKIMYHTHK